VTKPVDKMAKPLIDVDPLGKNKVKSLTKIPKHKIHKRKKPVPLPSYKAEDLKLPKKFAEKVLELELEVDHG
jgi:hypothetical protein